MSIEPEIAMSYALVAFSEKRCHGDFVEEIPLSRSDFRTLQTCLKIVQAEEGCITPFETFFVELSELYEFEGVTPADVERKLATFRDDFDSIINSARYLLERYPKLIEAGSPQHSEEPEEPTEPAA